MPGTTQPSPVPRHGRPRRAFTHHAHADGIRGAALHGTAPTLIPEVHLTRLQAPTTSQRAGRYPHDLIDRAA